MGKLYNNNNNNNNFHVKESTCRPQVDAIIRRTGARTLASHSSARLTCAAAAAASIWLKQQLLLSDGVNIQLALADAAAAAAASDF